MATGSGARIRRLGLLLAAGAALTVLCPARLQAQTYHGGVDLGPNPGHIPMSPSLQRRIEEFFGARPRRPAPRPPARPAASRRQARPPAAAAAPVPRRGGGNRADLVALGLPPEAPALLQAEGFTIVAEHPGGFARLNGPPRLPEEEALARLRELVPGVVADRNHLYRLAAGEEDGDRTEARPPDPPPACAPGPSGLIALVDTGVDRARHPDLGEALDRQESLRGPGRRAAPVSHGTAVAQRLVSALPDARIAVLDAFHRGRDGEAADAFDLSAALARAAEIGAVVANVSVAGPANAVLERAGAEAAARGVVFVVAAGNEGPDAEPLYPAAYPWAVAVTAVDAEGNAWNRAAAGPHITFAAPGVEVPMPAGPDGRQRTGSGTSLAAPVVTAMLAVSGPAPTPAARVERLARRARDSGEPGRDPVYGWGVVELDACVLRRVPAAPSAAPTVSSAADG